VHAIWNLQVAGIVAAHVAAVFVAHVLALRRHGTARAALASQPPMTALMVAYTIFGLWLLATPVAA
jgi:FtsH-binding integral membrane protein